jgi:hypothetical protein
MWSKGMTEFTEEHIAELISVLRPAPTAWVQAAIDLPAARAAMDGLVARAQADREARDAILADLEKALREAGVEPSRPLLDDLRARLQEG